MSRSYRAALAAAGLAVLGLAAGCSSAPQQLNSPVAAAPGILKGSVTIGSYQPLTGPAAAGASEIAPASAAYFAYVNAHGGVYGRRIIYRYFNDRSRPALAPSIVHGVVQQDNVLAVFNGAGTEPHLTVAPFLNATRVPDVFAGSGCPCWNSPALPETFGWQLDYIREGKILGAYLAQHFKGQPAGLLYAQDEAGLDGAKGLAYAAGAGQITAREHYPPAGGPSTAQVKALRASGARVVAAFTSPAATAALRLAMARIGYHPQLIVASGGADPATLTALLTKAGGPPAASLAQGIITDSWLPSPASARNSWITLFRKIHHQYLPRLPFDINVINGMAAAYTFTQALLKAGPNPTRESLTAAISSGLPQGPAVAPLGYSAASHSGVTGAYLAIIRGRSLTPLTAVMTTGDTPTSPVTPYHAAQPSAPSSGLP